MRVKSGVEGFDAFLDGGFPKGSSIILQGPSGVEKELFYMHFLKEGFDSGESVIVVLSTKSPEKFKDRLSAMGLNADELLEQKRLAIIDWYSHKIKQIRDVQDEDSILRSSASLTNVSIALEKALSRVEGKGVRAVVEILSPALKSYALEDVYKLAQGCIAKLDKRNATSLFLLEKEMHDSVKISTLQQPFDGVVDIVREKVGDEIERKIGILSMKDSDIPSSYEILSVKKNEIWVGKEKEQTVKCPRCNAPVKASTELCPNCKLPIKKYLKRLFAIEKKTRQKPDDANSWLAKGILLSEMHIYEKALACFNTVLKLDERSKEAWNAKADVFTQQGKYNEAADCYKKALEFASAQTGSTYKETLTEEKAVEKILEELVEDEQEEKYSKELEAYEERLNKNPEDVDALYSKALVLNKMGRFRDAIYALHAVTRLDFKYPNVWKTKGDLFKKLGDYKKAGICYKRAQEFIPKKFACPLCGSFVPSEAAECPKCGVEFEGEREEEAKEPSPTAVLKPKPTVPPRPKPRKPEEERGLTNGLIKERIIGERAGKINGLINGTRAGKVNGLVNGKGRINGLINGTRAGKVNGLVNGKGRINGLINGTRAGKVNGLVNGKGRINGLINGVRAGKINGLINGGGGRINGLINGIKTGRINGIINGFRSVRGGLTNGLTNGMGLTNGLGSHRFNKETTMNRWKMCLIPLIAIALLFTQFMMPPGEKPVYKINIDGDFADWNGLTTSVGQRAALNPSIDIYNVGVENNKDYLSFYIETKDNILEGGDGTVDTFYIFIDCDLDYDTGYKLNHLGADYLVFIYGKNGNVMKSSLKAFDDSRSQNDWGGWSNVAGINAAANGNQLETQVNWEALGGEERIVEAVFYSQSYAQEEDFADYVASNAKGILNVKTKSVATEVITGTDNPLLELELTAIKADMKLTELEIELLGTAETSELSKIKLFSQEEGLLTERIPISKYITFRLDTPLEIAEDTIKQLIITADVKDSSGHTLGASIQSPRDVMVEEGIVSIGKIPSANELGYLGFVPTEPTIDGGFSDWIDSKTDSDASTVSNPNINIQNYNTTTYSSNIYFYLSVESNLMNGTPVPFWNRIVGATSPSGPPDSDLDRMTDDVDPYPYDFNNNMNLDSATNNDVDEDGIKDHPYGDDYWLNTTIPNTTAFPVDHRGKNVSIYIGPRAQSAVTGEDTVNIYIDKDKNPATGYRVNSIGADYMVSFSGKNGEVLSTSYHKFNSAQGKDSWIEEGNDVLVETNSRQLEAKIDPAKIGLNLGDEFDIVFGIVNWFERVEDFTEVAMTETVKATGVYHLVKGVGPDGGDRFGWNVSYAGDVNNDGYPDIIVGAPYNDSANGSVADAGAAYIFFGYAGIGSININAANANVTVYGAKAGDHLGWDVSDAGSFTVSTTYPDIIIGAPGNSSSVKGKAYIIDGYYLVKKASADNKIYMNTYNDMYKDAIVELVGGDDGDRFGASVSYAGDVDNDGFDDVIIGAPQNDTSDGSKSNAGGSYLIYGGNKLHDIVVADRDWNGISIYNGTSAGDWEARGNLSAGTAPTSVFVGDANNDGYNDIVFANRDDNDISIYNGTSGGGWEARYNLAVDIYPLSIFIGDANNDGYNDILTANRNADTVSIYNGTSSGGWESRSDLSTGDKPYSVFVGDANNDGYSDILMADEADSTVSILNGTSSNDWEAKGTLDVGLLSDPVSVFVGDANNDGYNDIVVADRQFDVIAVFNGTSSNDWETRYDLSAGDYPHSVFVGDANNDGYNDIVAGDANANTISIFNGTSSGWESRGTLSLGANYNAYSVFVDDANNDGYNDIVTPDTNGLSSPDRISIFNGTSSGWEARGELTVGDAPWSVFVGDANNDGTARRYLAKAADARFYGETAGDMFGFSLSSAGNVNNDNYYDLLVGAPTYDDGGNSDAGRAYVFNGSGSLSGDIDASAAFPKLTGGGADYHFGWSVSNCSDVNDDGSYDDVIVGAPDTTNGNAYIYHGGNPMDSTSDLTLTGENAGDKFGFSVHSAGDIGGDGIPDAVVGAPYYDNGALTDAGIVYVFNGSTSMGTTANYTHKGEQANEHFGWSVSLALNMNGSSYNAVVAGAPHHDDGSNANAGEAEVLWIIPEFSTVAIPIIAIIILLVALRRRKRKK